jgi:5-methyltetrahydrofolate--homocysteine methyltransferase
VELPLDGLAQRVMVCDGGWSTQLVKRGFPADAMAESANLTHPDLVKQLATEYADAGAEIIITNTFSANRFSLARHERLDELEAINREGAAAAKEAVGDRAVIVGSIGPSGKMLAVKEVTEEELAESATQQAQALAAGGVDAIVLETFSETAEILCVLKAVKAACELPVIASMSFDAGPQRTRTMMGARAEECAAALDDAGADVIGCNCGVGIEQVLPAVVALRGGTQKPLWVKPNAGMPELEDNKPVWKQTPEEFAKFVPQLIEAGANIVGGCCGSGPEHIAKVAAVVKRSGK